jgi:hypothetical protein
MSMPLRHRAVIPAIFISLALACLATASAEQATTVYTGTLGKQAIVLELTPGDDAESAGRYFYMRHHFDLLLEGKPDTTSHLSLSEGKDEDTANPHIELDRQADGSWRGSWRNAQGKTLAIALQPAMPSPPPADATPYLKQLYKKDPYEYLRLSGLKLQPGRQQSFMGHTLHWWTQPDSKISFFEIADGYPDSQRQRINRVLVDRLWSEVSSYYSCMATVSHSDDGDFEQTVTPRLLTLSLISISVFTSYDCGGAHPDFGDAPINLDARTAQPLTLEDILWLGKGKPLHYVDDSTQNDDATPASSASSRAGFDAFSAYRQNDFAPWLVQQLTAQYPTQMKGTKSDDDCGYDDPSVWEFVSWHLTQKGVFFGPSFPRVARVCESNDDWSMLPWATIRLHPGRVPLKLP